MKFLKEFSYPDIFQRRIVLINSFFGFFLLGMISFHCGLFIAPYTPYESAVKTVLLAVVTGLFAGNLAGNVLFRLPYYRVVFITVEMIYLSLAGLYFLKSGFAQSHPDPVLSSYFTKRPLFLLAAAVFAFFPGLKLNYSLKAATGDYIDEKRPVYSYLLILALGLALGALFAQAAIQFTVLYPAAALLILFVFSSAMMVKTPYFPQPIMVQDFKETHREVIKSGEEGVRRDSLLFTYLNFIYILIYCLLAYESICKFSGGWPFVKVLFLAIMLSSMCAGFVCARFVKASFWHIYTEMLFPVLFLIFMVLLYTEKNVSASMSQSLYAAPLGAWLGFSLYHTIRNIVTNYEHRRRFLILDLSLFMLPYPILLAFLSVELTNLWFFVLLYTMTLLNIVFPGVHLMQRAIAGYKKLIYFIFSISVIPLVIFAHLYFGIPIVDGLYVQYSSGFEALQAINVHQDFIKQRALVRFNGKEIFLCNDSTVKNLNRAMLTVLFFSRDARDHARPVLVLDGTQSFYRNPILGQFKSMRCIDYVSDRGVDYNRLPISGRQLYTAEKTELFSILHRADDVYETICDIPNLFDQSQNPVRFSGSYYGMVKKKLAPDGLFAQVFSVSGCRPEYFASACRGIKEHFSRTAVFFFSDHLLVLAANDSRTLGISKQGVDRVGTILKEHPGIAALQLNEYHLLSHYLTNDVTAVADMDIQAPAPDLLAAKQSGGIDIDGQLIEAYLGGSAGATLLLDTDPANFELAGILPAALNQNEKTLSLLKRAELAAARMEYETETEALSQLKALAEYNADLRAYSGKLTAFREEYFFSEAIRFEKDKRWEEASRLYRAILRINAAHFEANYRMGILSITLQNLDDAFKFLQHAMELRRDDPRVLYQMGVLLFSSGQTTQALEYFTRTLALRESPESLFHYMGLCYEKLGRPEEAKPYYEKALLADPNDSAVQSSIERISQALQARRVFKKPQDRKNQMDVEQDETMPLPINQTAKDIRLKDSEVPPEETDPAKQPKK